MVSNFKFVLFLYINNILFNHFIVFFILLRFYYYAWLLCLSLFLFYYFTNGNHYMTLHILLKGFESINLIYFTDPP